MTNMIKSGLLAVAAAAVLGFGAHAGATLDAIKDNGRLKCGVSTGLAGFAAVDSQGVWQGIDVDYCKALAAAVLDDPDAVDYVPLTSQQRFTALQAGEIDILSRHTTLTLTRDGSLGLVFAGVTFYDGQGFIVSESLGVQSALDLDGATICIQPGTTTELNLADYFRANGMDFVPFVVDTANIAAEALASGSCDVYTTDASGLAATKATKLPNPDEWVILPEIISKEPLGPVVRRGDDEFFTIAKWILYALVQAEESGVTAGNIDSMMDTTDPVIARLVGASGELGSKALGLSDDWAVKAIKAVGNYGEMYERNIVPIGLVTRGINNLWTRGGLMYAMPLR
jgi:general L-amino acid transport system substrate-binding protein